MKIGFVYDRRLDYIAEGFSEEAAGEFDSDATLDAIEAALRAGGHAVDRIGHGRRLAGRLAAGDRWDLVFNVAEGLRGRSREAQVPALLELYGLAYTFSDPLTCAATLDKAVAKRLVQAARLRTAPFAIVRAEQDLAGLGLDYPVFAKPLAEGTGKGVDGRSRCGGAAELQAACARLLAAYRQPVLVEEYLPGREFTTALLGTGAAARVVGTMEIRLRPGAPHGTYSFEVKERCEQFVDYPALERGPLRRAVERLALAAYRALECRDAARIDIKLDRRGRPAFMECNPLPGLHPQHSDLPMIATQAGLSYEALIAAIVASAAERRAPGAPA